MTRVRHLLLLLPWLCACTAAGAAPDDAIAPVVRLRDSGYLLGDLLDERVELRLPAGSAIDPASLPAPGRVAPWLEVRSARADPAGSDDAVVVTVTYQIFAEAEQVTRVPIPPFKIRLVGGSVARLVEVPEKSFLLSPALPTALSDEDRELKPSPPPQPLSTTRTLAALAASLLVAACAAGWLLWVHDRLPFLPHAPGPFARLWRRWRGRDRRGDRAFDPIERSSLLREWHLALNDVAGETLYASTLPQLFERAPYLLPLRARIEALFERSWQAFYGAAPVTEVAAADLFAVLREAALRERGVPC